MRVGFVTCVQLGLSCMQAIYEAGGRLAWAGTLQDHLAPNKSGKVSLDSFCGAHAIPLAKFRNVNDPDALESLRAADLDWLMIIGWSQIARQAVLDIPRQGVIGMHPSLLPIGRGRSAIPWAILLDLPETGVTLFKLDGGVDTGPIIAQVRLPLSPRETATGLYARVNQAHRDLIAAVWPQVVSGHVRLSPQDSSKATVWAGRTPDQGRLDPAMTVVEADRLVRAVSRPYPGAFLDLNGRRLRIWASEPAAAGSKGGDSLYPFSDGWLRVTEGVWEEAS